MNYLTKLFLSFSFFVVLALPAYSDDWIQFDVKNNTKSDIVLSWHKNPKSLSCAQLDSLPKKLSSDETFSFRAHVDSTVGCKTVFFYFDIKNLSTNKETMKAATIYRQLILVGNNQCEAITESSSPIIARPEGNIDCANSKFNMEIN